jgi:exosortase B
LSEQTIAAPKDSRAAWLLLAAGFGSLYLPTLWRLSQEVWRQDQQAHGPLILAIAAWLLWRARASMLAAASEPSRRASVTGWTTFLLGLLMYVLGRSQDIEYIELGSAVVVLAGLVLACLGAGSLRAIWFPLFFMLFMVPLPGLLVAWFTMPMKLAVSFAAEQVLHLAGYPIGRMGVILQIGQYQLLVADACAGLHTLLTLEALGLLYLNLTPNTSLLRNVLLALLVIPISFCANVIRVATLALITYHFGDEAGQGFLHGFAGMVLFVSALALVIAADAVLRTLTRSATPRVAVPS